MIEWIVSVFFCAQKHVGATKRKEMVIVSMLGTKRKERRVTESVFGRESDSQALIKELGCSGYLQRFYEFLQGKFHPENIYEKDCPNLSKEQAWHVIYCMQEYFGIFDDRFECCKICGTIFDSYEEGTSINEDTEPVEQYSIGEETQIHRFTEAEYGHYCGDCRPDE